MHYASNPLCLVRSIYRVSLKLLTPMSGRFRLPEWRCSPMSVACVCYVPVSYMHRRHTPVLPIVALGQAILQTCMAQT